MPDRPAVFLTSPNKMIVRHNLNQKSRVKSFFALEAEEKSHLDIKKIQKKRQKEK
jgi:hypothetical protein